MNFLSDEERMLPRILLIDGPIGLGDEMIVPGDLEGSCNMVISIWSFEGNTYRSICDN